MEAVKNILPVSGRGTIRRMVEGRLAALANACDLPLHPAAARRGPPPQIGEDL